MSSKHIKQPTAENQRVQHLLHYFSIISSKHTRYLMFAALIAIVSIYVALAITPSHYAIGLYRLGSQIDPLLFSARSIRSDDWAVLTPLFQTAVNGHFATTNQFSPYSESLKSFFAIPILDWSLVFKPQLWAFWLIPAPHAYSFYFATLWVAFIVGYTILLTQLGARNSIAVLGSFCLFFSGLVQVWWTSHAPAFAFAPWPLIAFLLPIKPLIKLPLLFWTCAVWIFAFVYPPFIIPGAFALGILLIAFRRDALSAVNLVTATIAVGALVISFALYFGELIWVMQQTIYPGQRNMSGGGVEQARLVSHLFPFFATRQFDPLIANSNECEVAVVSTLLPATIIFFINYRSLLTVIKQQLTSVIVIASGLALMLAWMTLPVPASVGKLFLWNLVPPTRMSWGFGLLLTASIIIFASRCSFVLSPGRLAAFAICTIAAWLLSKAGLTYVLANPSLSVRQNITRSWFDWLVIIPFLFVAVVRWRYSASNSDNAPALFAAALTAGAITFGTYNPLQQAFLIFDPPLSTPVISAARDQQKVNPNGWAAVPGWYGALFSGIGISAINHTLTAPAMNFFRKIYPEMDEVKFNLLFNRYAHTALADISEPETRGDVVFLPIKDFLNCAGSCRGTNQ